MRRLLIANRGEIALRILRAARDAGIGTVAAYTRIDAGAPYLRLADDAVCIDHRSYLKPDALVAAALSRGCDAIHPGYGFLSENADFAAQVESHGLVFVGPAPADIALMADKSVARRHMAGEGIPTLPGSDDPVEGAGEAVRVADAIGYPVMLKAAHGGGGRGILVAQDGDALRAGFDTLRGGAEQLFGDGALYVEKYLEAPRHIEIQVAGDGNGSVIGFGARECSIQRAHQKLLEEAPPPGIDAGQLDALQADCCRVLAGMRYRSAGTLEFLYADGAFYFIEMNTRIQVEHPVTEMVTGCDLVQLQLEIAATGSLPLAQADVQSSGHAIECRINAEDAGFIPAPGRVTRMRAPGGPGVRLDTHVVAPYEVPHAYDSLVAKLICHGATREQAIERMRGALSEMDLRGLTTNIALHRRIMEDASFRQGEYSTQFLTAFPRG